MYYFKEVEKAKILQGRTITYLAKQLNITRSYLCSILGGKRGCSIRLANDITRCISWGAKIEDYFYEKGE